MSDGIQLTEPRASPASSTPSKRKATEGKDALLTVKPSAPLETKAQSPHKGDRGCGCAIQTSAFICSLVLFTVAQESWQGSCIMYSSYGSDAVSVWSTGDVIL